VCNAVCGTEPLLLEDVMVSFELGLLKETRGFCDLWASLLLYLPDFEDRLVCCLIMIIALL